VEVVSGVPVCVHPANVVGRNVLGSAASALSDHNMHAISVQQTRVEALRDKRLTILSV
jgi:hypothetical protein